MGLWDIDKIPYVGREKGPQEGLAFHYYDADKVVAGKKMKDWLRFGVAWWHTFDQELVDPFGTGTAQRVRGTASIPIRRTRPWPRSTTPSSSSRSWASSTSASMIVTSPPKATPLRETDKNLDKVVDKIEENMKSTGIKLLWNTSSLFTNPRFVSGAATFPVRRHLRLRRWPAQEELGDRQAPGR